MDVKPPQSALDECMHYAAREMSSLILLFIVTERLERTSSNTSSFEVGICILDVSSPSGDIMV